MMRFEGGPWDGETRPVEKGFRAPNGVMHRDHPDGRYLRTHVEDEGVHVYRWSANGEGA